MVNAGRVLGITLVDHVIVGRASPERPCGFISLRECGMLMF